MSNRQLEQVLADVKAMHKGIGGTSLQIEIDNTPVFVKKVPLTDLELLPENHMSTANIFNLPMCYQYGIGSAGFGAWRELAAHVMTTNWVITGQCPNFPIMYHWRILKDADNKIISNEEQVDLDKYTVYWENNQEIDNRLKAKALVTHHIYLFLEFIPNHLYDWLKKQLSSSESSAIDAIKLVEHQIQETNDFQNFLHMDAHFENILTDGKQLYYSDFGLALSDKFTLSNIEKHFRKGVYSALAGFVDIGETAEYAAHREVQEEVGLKIKSLKYFGSQSWPFPSSFMIAFTADHLDGEIIMEPNEIEDAQWFGLNQLPDLPPMPSISRQLINSVLFDLSEQCNKAT